jgi:hypothetical protein
MCVRTLHNICRNSIEFSFTTTEYQSKYCKHVICYLFTDTVNFFGVGNQTRGNKTKIKIKIKITKKLKLKWKILRPIKVVTWGWIQIRGRFYFSLNKIIPRNRVTFNHYNIICTIEFPKLQGGRKFLASTTPSSVSSVGYSTVASFWNATFNPFCYYATQHWKCSPIFCYIQDYLQNIYTYLSSLPNVIYQPPKARFMPFLSHRQL